MTFTKPLDSPLQTSTEISYPGDTGILNFAALRFFTSAIIWFDIIACISTRSRPHLVTYHRNLLSSASTSEGYYNNSRVQLHRIMGCQNWAMASIGEIAQLASTPTGGSVDLQKIAHTGNTIQKRLEAQSLQVNTELIALQQNYSGPPPHFLPDIYNHYVTLVVTRFFACAAFIYLRTAVTAHLTVFHIKDLLQDAIAAMSLIPDPCMIRGMVWPLCVAGCMASSLEDQETFRIAAKRAVQDAPTFGNSIKALEILEGSWEMQREHGRLVDCTTTIEKLGKCVLLV